MHGGSFLLQLSSPNGEASLKRVEPFRQMCSGAEDINALLAHTSAFAHWYSLKLPASDSARFDGESK